MGIFQHRAFYFFSKMTENAEFAPAISGAEKRKLRSRAQLLSAKISIGKNGVSQETLKTLSAIFKKEDLVKIRFSEGHAEMKSQIAEIERGTGAICIGNVGKTAAFFKAFLQENFAEE